MDPELLAALLSNAKKGNKNLSGVLGNMDNSILLAMAGVLDPYYGTGKTTSGAGQLYGSFAGDETTPAAVKAVMDYVDQGMNAYQIEAQINALDPNVIKDSGYTDQQLISMGKEMAKEGGKKGTNVFAKAGLRNPNDIYGVEDVPLNDSQNKDYLDYLGKAKESKRGEEKANWDLAVARNNMSKYKDQPIDVPDWYPTGSKTPDYIKEGMIAAAKNMPEDYLKTSMIKAAQNAPKDYLKEGMIGAAKNAPTDYLKEGMIGAAKNAPEDYMKTSSGYSKDKKKKVPSQAERDAISRAQAGVADVDTQVQADLMRAQAVREGALMRASAQGRTPFTDQTSALLKFIAGSK